MRARGIQKKTNSSRKNKIGTSQHLYLKLARCQRGTLSEFLICFVKDAAEEFKKKNIL